MKFNLILLVSFLLFSVFLNAQRISYAEPRGNFDHTQYNIIGSIKNNIIIWEYFNNDYSTSRILVYDNDLKLLNKIKVGGLNRFASLSFINEKDSFDVIYQYVSNQMFFCKRISFDGNGNKTRLEPMDSYKLPANIIATKGYTIFQSPDKKNFILVRSKVNEDLDTIELSYILFANNKIRFDHKTDLPYNNDSSTSYVSSLDNANHFIVVAGKGEEDNEIVLYEINPGTGDVAGIKGTVKQGVLNIKSLNISNADNHIFITAHWKNNENGIFVWQPDVYNFSSGKDTIYTEGIDTNFAFAKNEFLKTEVWFFHNTYNFFIAGYHDFFYYPGFDQDQNFSSGYTPESLSQGNNYSESFYDGRINSVLFNNSATINGVNTLNAYKDRDVNPTLSNQQQSQPYQRVFFTSGTMPYNKLLIYNIDENQNLHWQNYFDSAIESNFTSYINYSGIFYAKQLKLIYCKVDKNNVQQMSLLNINNEGKYTIEPVIVMKTSYKCIFSQSKQISNDAVVYPCNVKGKFAFIKIEAE